VLTIVSMALGVMMVVAVLTIHGVVERSFASNSTLGYNVIVGPKGGKLQLTLNTVYYLSQPVENVPYDFYLEFVTAEKRHAEYADSLRQAALEAQTAALSLASFAGVDSGAALGDLAGEEALAAACKRALDFERDGQYAIYTNFVIP